MSGLAVEPLRSATRTEAEWASIMIARLLTIVTGREVRDLKAKLQRMNPQEDPDAYAKLFGELVALESYHRGVQERGHGGL